MIEEFMIYARCLNDYSMDWDKDINRNTYISAARSKNTCKGRNKKRNMNHVSRLTKSKHRRGRK